MEDIALDQGLNKLLNGQASANLQDCDGDDTPDNFACGFDFYFITNPGESATVWLPTDAATGNYDAAGEGAFKQLTVPAELLGYPKAERKYVAVDLSFARHFGQRGFVQGSYTWSQSYGNYEGIVNSTIQQTNVAITQDFDQPGFLEGAKGFLPNDRRHKFKLFGSYQWLESLETGATLYAQSGRPYSALGYYPDFERPEAVYGQFSYYTKHPDYSADPDASVLVPRGTAGRTPWVWNLDISVTWQPALFERRLKAGFDIYNILNNHHATMVNEISEDNTGAPSSAYRLPRDFQDPRAVQLRIEYQL